MLLQDPGGYQLDGGVAVMAAGVHDAGVLGGEGEAGLLLDGEGVNVAAEHDGLPRAAALQNAHHAGFQVTLRGDAQGFQVVLNDPGGAEFLQPQLRMGVEVPAQGDKLIPLLRHGGLDVKGCLHTVSPSNNKTFYLPEEKRETRSLFSGIPGEKTGEGRCYAKTASAAGQGAVLWRITRAGSKIWLCCFGAAPLMSSSSTEMAALPI